MSIRLVVLILIALGLFGCARYSPLPLSDRVDAPQSASSVFVDPTQLPFHELSSHQFNPADGLDIVEVTMLAVVNNPQLKQARDNLNIGKAQSFAAGLLPDPQLGINVDHPTNGTTSNSNAFSLSPSYDVSALLLHSSRKNAATADLQRVNLELLWQEWQVASQARLVFIRTTSQRQLLQQLQAARTLLTTRYQKSRQALMEGNVTVDFASTDLIALQTVERQINELERSRLQNVASLNELLGLAANTPLQLVTPPEIAPVNGADGQTYLEKRLKQRPDLLALQAGYHSQEEKFRGAILAQFPALNLGLTRARDTSGLYSLGFTLSLSLPNFNANRGNIAIEKATRQQLLDEYQARLNSAYNEIATALENLSLLQQQLDQTRLGETELKTVAERAEAAYQVGNLAAPDYVRLQSSLLDKQIEAITLQEALMEQQIALEALLGPVTQEPNGK